MGIKNHDYRPLVFHLKRFSALEKNSKKFIAFAIEAKRDKDKKVWTEQIEKMLWAQLNKCKGNGNFSY